MTRREWLLLYVAGFAVACAFNVAGYFASLVV